jgi:hypothetical protein
LSSTCKISEVRNLRTADTAVLTPVCLLAHLLGPRFRLSRSLFLDISLIHLPSFSLQVLMPTLRRKGCPWTEHSRPPNPAPTPTWKIPKYATLKLVISMFACDVDCMYRYNGYHFEPNNLSHFGRLSDSFISGQISRVSLQQIHPTIRQEFFQSSRILRYKSLLGGLHTSSSIPSFRRLYDLTVFSSLRFY